MEKEGSGEERGVRRGKNENRFGVREWRGRRRRGRSGRKRRRLWKIKKGEKQEEKKDKRERKMKGEGEVT